MVFLSSDYRFQIFLHSHFKIFLGYLGKNQIFIDFNFIIMIVQKGKPRFTFSLWSGLSEPLYIKSFYYSFLLAVKEVYMRVQKPIGLPYLTSQ